MPIDTKETTGRLVASFVRQYYQRFQDREEIPGRGETFLKQELPARLQEDEVFFKMANRGVITPERFTRIAETSARRRVWRFKTEFFDRLEELEAAADEDSSGFLPCGHDGFSNLRDAPEIECTVCGERFLPAEVKARNGDGE